MSWERDRGERKGKDETIEVCGLVLFTQSQRAIQGNIFPQNEKKCNAPWRACVCVCMWCRVVKEVCYEMLKGKGGDFESFKGL